MRARATAVAAAALAPLVLAGAACASPAGGEHATGVRLVRVASGLSSPLYLTQPAGDARIFVVEQSGKVRIMRRGRVQAGAFLDVSALISTGGEQGLLGLAFHPQFAANGRVYAHYTNTDGHTRVVEYRVGADADAVDPGTARVLLRVEQPFANHNGGQIAFGPDGKLYVGLGDGGSGGDPQGNGQNLGTLLGKVLRIDVDARTGGLPYGIPADNPFVGRAGARGEIWHLGLRNPWRFSFDRQGGAMWIGDVGQNAFEEVDRAPAGRGGLNFGWNAREGRHPFPGGGAAAGALTGPVAEYPHSQGCSVTGGYVYRGARVPALRGRYVYADYCSGRVWTLQAAAARPRPRQITAQLGRQLGNVTSFGEDAAGELYVIAGPAVYRFARR